MKVLIIHNLLWAHYRSVLFEALEKHKTPETEILVLQIARNEISRKEMENVSAKQYSYNYKLLNDTFIEKVSLFKKIVQITRHLLLFKPDIVNISGYGNDLSLTLTLVIAKILGFKIVLTSESTSGDRKRNKFKELLKSKLIGLSNKYICFGSLSKQYLISLGVKPDQFIEDKSAVIDNITIRNEYDLAVTKPFLIENVKTKRNFIFIGRLLALKNIDLLLEAFKSLKNSNLASKDWGLIILGSGEEEEKLKNLASANKIDDVYFHPAVNWDKVSHFFVKSDVLVLPSNSEVWGLVVNEAMVCGLSIIVSDKCGCGVDLIDENGYIFDLNNKNGLLEVMNLSVNDEENLIKMKLKSEEIIQPYKVENVAKRILQGYTTMYSEK